MNYISCCLYNALPFIVAIDHGMIGMSMQRHASLHVYTVHNVKVQSNIYILYPFLIRDQPRTVISDMHSSCFDKILIGHRQLAQNIFWFSGNNTCWTKLCLCKFVYIFEIISP